MKSKYLIVLLTILFLSFTTLSYAQGGHHRDGDVIFNNSNIGGVLNNPTAPTTFTTNHSYRITNIMTYHWNNGYGPRGGKISLRSENGNHYGHGMSLLHPVREECPTPAGMRAPTSLFPREHIRLLTQALKPGRRMTVPEDRASRK